MKILEKSNKLSKEETFRGGKIMKYNTIYELNERGRATICPQCKNEDIADDANYCEICGASLINRCTNTECNTIGSGKARFCKECGSETEFGKRGYPKPWNTEG